MSAAAAIIELESVSRRFGTDPPINALRDVDLVVHEGEWLAVVGPSGSGKSTLLNIVGCLDRPTTGRCSLLGTDVATLADRDRAALRARQLGFVFQSFHLLSHRPVVDNVMLGEIYQGIGRRGRRERALEVLDRVGLSERVEYLPTRLSGGERQRVAIARSLLGGPRLLLADEPTGNLDSTTAAAILDVFRRLNADGLTVVMITHNPEVAAAAGRRVRIVDGLLSGVA